MRVLRPLTYVVLLALTACATTQGQGGDSDRDVITREDVERNLGAVRTAYQLVERLHPQWLRTRSNRVTFDDNQAKMEGDVVVYLDGTRLGGPAVLRDVDAETVQEIRYLNAARATRFGTGHQHGAIMVQTRGG